MRFKTSYLAVKKYKCWHAFQELICQLACVATPDTVLLLFFFLACIIRGFTNVGMQLPNSPIQIFGEQTTNGLEILGKKLEIL